MLTVNLDVYVLVGGVWVMEKNYKTKSLSCHSSNTRKHTGHRGAQSCLEKTSWQIGTEDVSKEFVPQNQQTALSSRRAGGGEGSRMEKLGTDPSL